MARAYCLACAAKVAEGGITPSIFWIANRPVALQHDQPCFICRQAVSHAAAMLPEIEALIAAATVEAMTHRTVF